MSAIVVVRRLLKETIALALVAIAAFVIALLAYASQREHGIKPSFYQSFYEPAIRMACGQPFGVNSSKQLTDQMRRFLNVEQQTLACEEVPPPVELKHNPAERAWYYLFLTTATIWKVTGISWPALEGLAAALLALAAVMVFRKYQKADEDGTVVLSKRIQGENMILTIAEPYPGNPSGSESNSGMLRIDIGGPDCVISTKRISIRFGGRDPNAVLEKELTIRLDPTRNSATVFYPAYFRKERFETLSLVVPEQEIGCLKRVNWLRPEELPALWVQATLYGVP